MVHWNDFMLRGSFFKTKLSKVPTSTKMALKMQQKSRNGPDGQRIRMKRSWREYCPKKATREHSGCVKVYGLTSVVTHPQTYLNNPSVRLSMYKPEKHNSSFIQLYWKKDSWQETQERERKRERFNMQQRLSAGVEPATLQLYMLCLNH